MAERPLPLAPLPPAEAPRVSPLSTTSAKDRQRLVGSKHNPKLEALLFERGYQSRIDKVRAGERGLRGPERPWIERELAQLDRADLLQLKKLILERPPHPRLAEVAKPPAVVGPPTVQSLLTLLEGLPFGHLPEAQFAEEQTLFERLAPLGLPICFHSGEWMSGTIRSYTPQGGVLIDCEGRERPRQIALDQLIERYPELLTPEIEAALEAGTRLFPPARLDISRFLFANAEHLDHDKVLRQTPELLPVGLDVFAPHPTGVVESGWRIAGFDEAKEVLLERATGERQTINIDDLLSYNRVAFLGPAALSNPISTHLPDTEQVEASESFAVFDRIDQTFGRAIARLAERYRACPRHDRVQRAEVEEWASQGGDLLWKLVDLQGLVGGRGYSRALQRGNLRTELGAIDAALSRWLETRPAPATTHPPPPMVEQTITDVESTRLALQTTLTQAADEFFERGDKREPKPLLSVSVSPQLTEPTGRIAEASELEELLADFVADPRFATQYTADGCYARAHLLADRLAQAGLAGAKLFVIPDAKDRPGGGNLWPDLPTKSVYRMEWSFHTAAVAWVRNRETGEAEMRILDPGFSTQPMTVEAWAKRFQCPYNSQVNYKLEPDTTYDLINGTKPELYPEYLAECWRQFAQFREILRNKET